MGMVSSYPIHKCLTNERLRKINNALRAKCESLNTQVKALNGRSEGVVTKALAIENLALKWIL